MSPLSISPPAWRRTKHVEKLFTLDDLDSSGPWACDELDSPEFIEGSNHTEGPLKFKKKCPDNGAFMVVLSYYFRKQFED
jgi:hypothetical protein